ncbi:MAG: hypothetical protein NXI00_05470 [Cytophagales bacterium]|nr:hypothetical protein [Cytophagales bacterium]
MKTKLLIISGIFLPLFFALGQASEDSTSRKWHIGSTLFILGNFIPDDPNPPDFGQLNVGYRLTQKDVISIEFKSWKYAWPLGIPYGKNYNAPSEKYPGFVREFGIALAYQRFIWKGFYAAIHGMNTLQRYVDNDGNKIQNGYQLFMTYRAGYHIPLFKKRYFLEPSIAITQWPINTNVPASFAALEQKWPALFLAEPGLHFGFRF